MRFFLRTTAVGKFNPGELPMTRIFIEIFRYFSSLRQGEPPPLQVVLWEGVSTVGWVNARLAQLTSSASSTAGGRETSSSAKGDRGSCRNIGRGPLQADPTCWVATAYGTTTAAACKPVRVPE